MQKNEYPGTEAPEKEKGFTLVEMMVALLVGFLVLSGISQIFIKTKRASVLQDELARMQENSRYAMQILGNEIRNAGYLGCRHSSNMDAAYLDTEGTYLDDFSVAMEGFEATGTGPGDAFVLNEATKGWSNASGETPYDTVLKNQPFQPGSDILVIRYAHGPGLSLTEDKQNDSLIRVANVSRESQSCPGGSDGFSGLCAGGEERAIISDCERARVFRIGALDLTGGGTLVISDASGTQWVGEHNSSRPFTKADASVFSARTVAFFVRDNGTGNPALYRKIGDKNAEELVEGVENIQVVFGEDSDGDGVANQYIPADEVANFSRVVSVRLSLMFRTIRESAGKSKGSEQLNMLATSVTTPSDRHYRRVFTTTIQLRNPYG